MDVRHPLIPRRGLAGLVGALVGAGLAAGLSGCAVGGGAGESSPSTTAQAPSAGPASPVAQRVGSVVPEAPVGVLLPDGRKVGIRTVGTRANGLLDVPSDIGVAGWWSGGSRLGDPFGSTLVAAHVDSTTQGLGPFATLLSVRAGDRLTVWSTGLKQTFAVTSLRLRPRSELGADSWLHSPEGERRLTLVTCAGPYDAARGGYQNLAVITAKPTGEAVPRP